MSADVLIVEARLFAHISDALVEGATAALNAAGVRFERISVPSALEIPTAVLFAAKAGEGAGKSFDGFVALGCVIRDETFRFEIVARESARGLSDLGLHHSLCIGNGILTVDTELQALERAAPKGRDEGGEAARSCLALIELKARLGVRR